MVDVQRKENVSFSASDVFAVPPVSVREFDASDMKKFFGDTWKPLQGSGRLAVEVRMNTASMNVETASFDGMPFAILISGGNGIPFRRLVVDAEAFSNAYAYAAAERKWDFGSDFIRMDVEIPEIEGLLFAASAAEEPEDPEEVFILPEPAAEYVEKLFGTLPSSLPSSAVILSRLPEIRATLEGFDDMWRRARGKDPESNILQDSLCRSEIAAACVVVLSSSYVDDVEVSSENYLNPLTGDWTVAIAQTREGPISLVIPRDGMISGRRGWTSTMSAVEPEPGSDLVDFASLRF